MTKSVPKIFWECFFYCRYSLFSFRDFFRNCLWTLLKKTRVNRFNYLRTLSNTYLAYRYSIIWYHAKRQNLSIKSISNWSIYCISTFKLTQFFKFGRQNKRLVIIQMNVCTYFLVRYYILRPYVYNASSSTNFEIPRLFYLLAYLLCMKK